MDATIRANIDTQLNDGQTEKCIARVERILGMTQAILDAAPYWIFWPQLTTSLTLQRVAHCRLRYASVGS